MNTLTGVCFLALLAIILILNYTRWKDMTKLIRYQAITFEVINILVDKVSELENQLSTTDQSIEKEETNELS